MRKVNRKVKALQFRIKDGTRTGYRVSLDIVLSGIADKIEEMGWSKSKLAKEASLCNSTVYRLFSHDRNHTKSPHLFTVMAIYDAVGYSRLEIAIHSEEKRRGQKTLKKKAA